MQFHVCALWDKKTETYAPPFYVRHLGQAERWIANRVINPDDELGKFAHDYELHHLGLFDDTTGQHLTRTEDNGGAHVPRLLVSVEQIKKSITKEMN